jgi:hypothetical protein
MPRAHTPACWSAWCRRGHGREGARPMTQLHHLDRRILHLLYNESHARGGIADRDLLAYPAVGCTQAAPVPAPRHSRSGTIDEMLDESEQKTCHRDLRRHAHGQRVGSAATVVLGHTIERKRRGGEGRGASHPRDPDCGSRPGSCRAADRIREGGRYTCIGLSMGRQRDQSTRAKGSIC